MSKLSFRARALDASKPMPIYLAEELPDLPDYSAINRAVPQMPSGMEKEEESEHHLQRAISGTGLIIPTPEVSEVNDIVFYEKCYPPDYKMPKQHIHMQPLWEEQEAPEYDIDSEDERWLKQQRHPELTEWKFEQMMDKLEKSSGQTVVTLNEAKLLLERQDDLVTAVYDYWLNKRLTTQHPLILSVKTESRPGQSTNNPYLAFRRRTEKMQTRKNRKNDESSYEKMLKLRRDLARALTLLELVARRETAKRELVRLTASLAERRHRAKDYSPPLPDPAPRPQYPCVAPTGSLRALSTPHFPPKATPAPLPPPRQREKRPYKRRKYRHNAVGSTQGLRETGSAGAATSSEEETSRTEAATDDGPFAFRRKPGCYYEMPTSTLCGDPLDQDKSAPDTRFDHEIDVRQRFTLTSVSQPYPHCIGFARRRLGRGGRVLLDRVSTPLNDLWGRLPEPHDNKDELEIEKTQHRIPKVITRDYHTSGKYPWRHAFRQHLAKNSDLWIDEPDLNEQVKPEVAIKTEPDFKSEMDISASDNVYHNDTEVKSDKCNNTSDYRTIDGNVRDSLQRVARKRALSCCSDASYESDDSLQPVEKVFEGFINEVNKKWLHFRPKTPPPSPPRPEDPDDDLIQISSDTPLTVELRTEIPTNGLDTFMTSEFTLSDLYGDINPEEKDTSRSSLDVSGEDLLGENFTGLTEAQVESILSETDLKALSDVDLTKDDKKITDEILELVNDEKDPFLLQGQDTCGRACPGARRRAFGSSGVRVTSSRSPLTVTGAPRPLQVETQPVPTSKIIVEEVNEVPQIKIEKKRKEETIEEVQLPSGVQLKTVHTKHSPLKKHIITAAPIATSVPPTIVIPPSISNTTIPTVSAPQIVTVAVSDSLKMRLQNHLLSSQAGVILQNGPQTDAGGRRTTPLVLAHKPPVVVGGSSAAVGMGVGMGMGVGARLRVVHAAPLAGGQRVCLAPPGSVFELAHKHRAKGPHLVNVVRQPASGKGVSRVELAGARRQVLAVGPQPAARPALSVGQLLRPPHARHQIQLKNRTLQVATPIGRNSDPSSSIATIATPAKTASIPSSVVANLLQKNVQLPKGGQKLSIGGAPLAANVQAIAFTAAQLKARQARLVQPRPQANNEIVVEAGNVSAPAPGAAPMDTDDETVRRRDSLPMEVT